MSEKLEEMLVEEGLLSLDQYIHAQESAKPNGIKVQEYLIREGLVADTDMVNVLSSRLHIQRYDPDRFPVDPGLASALPATLAGKHRMVPLQENGDMLIVAMPDPTDVVDIDIVQRQLKKEVEPIICTETEYYELMNSLYGIASGIGSFLDDIETVDYGAAEAEEQSEPSEEAQIQALMDMAEGSAAVRSVDWIMSRAVREGASDVHVSPEKDHVNVRLRVDGRLKDLPPLPKSMLLSVVSRLKILGRMDIAVTRVPQDGRFTARLNGREINVRVSALPTIYGENMVLRLLDMNALVFKLKELGMGHRDVSKIEQVIKKPHGMILNTGPTGSGKTTTLYSVLEMLNQPDVNIITVEDPVEYRIPRIRQVELNTKAGMTFANSLRTILRQDPDIAMVGEIRDTETAEIAVQASLTGHLVLSTVHTNSAIGTISRLLDMGIEPFLIASVLSCVIGQRLVRRVCSHCAEPYMPSANALDYWGLSPDPGARFLKAKGCHHCRHTGYRGRIGVYEVLPLTENLQSLIANQASEAELMAAAKEAGNFTTMREDAANKIRKGITTLEEATANVAI